MCVQRSFFLSNGRDVSGDFGVAVPRNNEELTVVGYPVTWGSYPSLACITVIRFEPR